MRRLLNGLGNVLLTVLIMLLIGYGWAFFELKIMLKDNPELMGYVFYQQTDNSMEPDFSKDDIVITKIDEKYEVGDKVLMMSEDNKYVVRTVSSIGANVSTSCTKCNEDNKEVSKNAIIGKSVAKVVGFGKLINFFKQKWFLITLAVVGFLMVVISQYIHETPKKVF